MPFPWKFRWLSLSPPSFPPNAIPCMFRLNSSFCSHRVWRGGALTGERSTGLNPGGVRRKQTRFTAQVPEGLEVPMCDIAQRWSLRTNASWPVVTRSLHGDLVLKDKAGSFIPGHFYYFLKRNVSSKGKQTNKQKYGPKDEEIISELYLCCAGNSGG